MRSHCRAYALRDVVLLGWHDHIAGQWSYRQLAADDNWRHGWISFDALRWNSDDRRLYCGLNSIDGDLLYSFDPEHGCFNCLRTQRWTDAFDSKIHRTLLWNPVDASLYFGTSLLHDADDQHAAPGGKLVRYSPAEDAYEMLGIPEPHLYIQSIAGDFARGIVYAFTYPAEFVVRFDLATRTGRRLAYIGNAIMFAQPHNAVVDKHGCLWGTYAETRAWDETIGRVPIRLFKYNPDTDHFDWFEHGLARKSDEQQLIADPPKPANATVALAETRHREDFGFCDSMAYDGDRYIYAGTVAGVLCRIDVETARVEKIAHVMATSRFPALQLDARGVLYGGGGMKGHTQVIRWDPRTDKIDDLGPLVDPNIGERPARIHELAVDDHGRVYLAENDNHVRSSYLWVLEPR
ncbi:MAG: hypothetical protein WD042_11510 [Phycisphaeraceae bacterium]